MKNSLTVLVMAILLMPLLGGAQKDVFEKYSENSDVTYVSIKPIMFQMIAKMGIDINDAEAKAYMDMVKSITSFKTIITDKAEITSDLKKWVSSRSKSLEELMEVKDDGAKVEFYVKEGKDADHVSELLIFVNDAGKMLGDKSEIDAKGGKMETVLVSLTGDIDLNEISKLTSQMNIPGGAHLEKNK